MGKNGKLSKITKTIVLSMMAVMIVFAAVPVSADAAVKTKSKTYVNYPLEARGAIKALDVYGRDTLKIKYNGQKIISVAPSQYARNLGTKICEKGGIKCTYSTSAKRIYSSTWYVNFSILPKWMIKIADKVTPKLGAIADCGRFVKSTTTYTVYKNGNVTKSSKMQFMVPTKLRDAAKKLAGLIIK